MNIEQIIDKGQIIALIIPGDFTIEQGIHFFTPDEFSQQLGYIHHPCGKVIQPHQHLINPRHVNYTQEVLLIKKGRLRVDFYDNQHIHIESHILNAGDLILLASGGHDFEILEEVEMIEIKQGPYAGDEDKERF